MLPQTSSHTILSAICEYRKFYLTSLNQSSIFFSKTTLYLNYFNYFASRIKPKTFLFPLRLPKRDEKSGKVTRILSSVKPGAKERQGKDKHRIRNFLQSDALPETRNKQDVFKKRKIRLKAIVSSMYFRKRLITKLKRLQRKL